MITRKRRKGGIPSDVSSKGQPSRSPTTATPYHAGKSFWDLWTDGITQGLLATFLTCPEKLRLRMTEGYSPLRGSGALAFGSLTHEVLDKVYTGIKSGSKNHGKLLAEALKSCEEDDRRKMVSGMPSVDPRAQQQMEENYGVCEVLLEAYNQHWKRDLQDYDWLALEQTFNVPFNTLDRLGLARPVIPVRGKRDGVFRQGKELWLFETKTKARLEDETTIDKLSFDLQVMLYLWGMKHDYDEVPKGVIYNLIRKPQLRQGVKESLKDYIERIRGDVAKRPEFYFVRFAVSVLPEELEAWELELNAMVRLLIQWWEGGFHYRNSSACGNWGGCENIGICSRGDFAGFIQREEVFPELVQIGS